MKKVIHVILFFIYVTFQTLITNSLILLNAQPGWSEDMRLTYRAGYSYDPRAACNGDTIHLVWWEGYVDNVIHEEVFYKRSTDAGMTWGEDVRLSVEDGNSSYMPVVDCNGSKVYIFWLEHNYGTLFRKSIDGGTTWGPIDSTLQGAGYHDIYVLNDTIYLAGGRNPGDIIFRKSTDGGSTWLPLKVVGFGCYVNQAVNAPIIGFVYQVTQYRQEIMFKRSTDNGMTWSDSMIISDCDSVSSQWSVIDVDTFGGLHIVWYDYKYSPYSWTGDIFYRASRDSGQAWEDIDSLTVIHRATASDILAEGNNLHVVWEDDRHDFGDNFEIYYRLSKDLGHTWGPELRLTDAPNWSRGPSLACDGKYLHLFWFDLRDDPSNIVGEIYYKRYDLSYSIEESNKSALVTNLRFDVHPNPFREILDVRWKMVDFSSTENIQRFTLKLFDVSGKEVMIYDLKDKIGGLKISTNHLSCGVYFVLIKAGEESGIKKVVKVE